MRPSSSVLRVAALASLLMAAACSSPGPGASFAERDPYESTNRAIHDFNVGADRRVLKPVSEGYAYVTPTLFQHLIGNAFNHIDNVNDFANFVLQGEFTMAGRSLARFSVNTILGAGGLLNPAKDFGIADDDSDFGVTLGKWGAPEGAYLVLPLLGPSTTRDAGGFVGDVALSPLTYSGLFFDSTAASIGFRAATPIEIIDGRARNADLINDLLYNSPDSYIQLRAVYLQRRDALIRGDAPGDAPLPDIFDDETPQN